MALDFTNASLLGYQVNNEFIGSAGDNHRKVISLNIEGFIDDGQKADVAGTRTSQDGVSESYAKIREQIYNGDDYWDSNIVINGKNFGKGRVLSLDFSSSPGTLTDQIRFGQYSASLEIYRVGDISQLSVNQVGEDSAQQIFAQYITSLTESLSFTKNADGSVSANQSFNLGLMSGDYGDTKSDPVTIAKSIFAGTQGGNWQSTPVTAFIIDAFDETILYGGIGSTFTEDYDLINFNFSFNKRWRSLPEGNVPNVSSNTPSASEYDYIAKTSRSIQESNGIISVSERGNVEGNAGDWFDMTGGMEASLNSAYSRCDTLFSDVTYQGSSPVIGHYPLNNTPSVISRQYDSGAGVGSYNVTFNNESGIGAYFTHRYTQSISKDNANITQVSENGSIITRSWKDPYWTTATFGGDSVLTEYGNRVGDSAFHAKEFYENFKSRLGENCSLPNCSLNVTSSKLTYPAYGKAMSYSVAYSDDPRILPDDHASKLKRVDVTVSDVAPIPIVKPYTIPHRGAKGEVIHEPGQTAPGTRNISVSATKVRECSYSNLTGNVENVLPDWTTANEWVLNKVMIPEVRKSIGQINAYILDMYVSNMTASSSSEGNISMSVDLAYTAAKVQPADGVFNPKTSNYNAK